MYPDRSHGRLLLVPVLVSLCLGGYLGVQVMHGRVDQLELERLEQVSSQGQLLHSGFWSAVDALKSESLHLYELRNAHSRLQTPNSIEGLPLPSGAILYWADIQTKGDSMGGIRQSAKNPAAKIGLLADEGFEESFQRSLLEKINLRELRENGVSIIRIKQDPQRETEWVALVFELPESQSGVIAALLDPMEAFPIFKNFAKAMKNIGMRAYWIGVDGHILAHSQPHYVGSNFGAAPLFHEALQAMIQGTRKPETSVHRSIDQISVATSFFKLGHLPMAWVVERPMTQGSLFEALRINGIWQKILGQFLAAAGLLSLLIWIYAWKMKKQSQAATSNESILNIGEITSNTQSQADTERVPAGLVAQKMESLVIDSELKNELQASQYALRAAIDEQRIVSEFEKDAARLKDPKSVVHKLSQSAAQLCNSPVLFFTYHEGLRAAILQADGGFSAGDSPVGMSFPVDAEAVQRIIQTEQDGNRISMAGFPPLVHILMARMGVAHFEAWPVTGYGHLGRQARNPRLLGVLVVLQAGFDSATHQESLNRMMRATGLIYENTLLSR